MSVKSLARHVVLLTLLLSACSDPDTDLTSGPADAQAIEANNLAVGLMGRFEYAKAEAGFAELVTRWPDWHDVRINLAIATLNTQQPGSETQALALALDVLRAVPENLRATTSPGSYSCSWDFPKMRGRTSNS